MGDTHSRGFENLIVDHVASGSWLGTLLFMCFVIAGALALLTTLICTQNCLLARGWIGNQQNLPHGPR
jgi:hypothetical protein